MRDYVRQAWHVVEPSTHYTSGWHIDAICEHLEAATRGEIRNLIINIPPRHMKSLAVCVFWPTWSWIQHPETRWLFASYAEALALRDSLKCRRLILSPWYQARWGDVYQLAGDQNQKGRFENDHSGYRLAVGVGGSATGEGGSFLIVDDPIKATDANSDAMREAANTWWDETMSTRGDDPRTVCKVVIMQRLHEEDLTGHLLQRMREGGEEYVHLCLPAEYEPRTYNGPLTWKDPRSEPGELLWPERFGRTEIQALKMTLTERGAAGQLQQRPAPAGGALFKREWWSGQNRYDPADPVWARKCVGRWLSVDTAFSEKTSADNTAIGVYELMPDYHLIKRDCIVKRIEFPALLREIESVAKRNNRDFKLKGVLIEDKGSGTSALQTLRLAADEWLRNILFATTPVVSKEVRWQQAGQWCERGMVLLPTPSERVPWLHDFEEELYNVPSTAHDDMADEFGQIILYLEHYLAEGYRLTVRGMMASDTNYS
ncbi:MAG: terminase [Pseudomonadota bacterium]